MAKRKPRPKPQAVPASAPKPFWLLIPGVI